MFDKIKQELEEIIRIADSCPEPYRVECFKILLQHTLARYGLPTVTEGPIEEVAPQKGTKEFARFCQQHDVTEEQLLKVFHLEDDVCKIIVKDLKEKEKAPQQIRLGLLLGIQNLYLDGNPLVPREPLRELCKQYGTYDGANFAANMKKHRDLFLIEGKDWKLTTPGLEEATQVIQDLSQGGSKE
ncbi:unnamed protein product [marine sediment metagenome]|uniref:Uncharacterized protein n=1 Tax=marine sediment metagenome TaxID=412755 RepID=X0ZSC6_9ZZZZ